MFVEGRKNDKKMENKNWLKVLLFEYQKNIEPQTTIRTLRREKEWSADHQWLVITSRITYIHLLQYLYKEIDFQRNVWDT
jgi:hypothetical protein